MRNWECEPDTWNYGSSYQRKKEEEEEEEGEEESRGGRNKEKKCSNVLPRNKTRKRKWESKLHFHFRPFCSLWVFTSV